MKVHFLHRLFLIPVTLLGVTFLVFTILKGLPQAAGYLEWLGIPQGGILKGDFGNSSLYQKSVLEIVCERLPIAAYFLGATAILTYGVAVPLGVLKAIYHRGMLDRASGLLLFLTGVLPPFALGILIFSLAGGGFGVLKIPGGNWNDWVAFACGNWLPLLCYLVAVVSGLSLTMKHSLMDELAAQYIRSAVAKGGGFSRLVLRHAFRNSLRPMASSFSSFTVTVLSSSILIESIFRIKGLGMLLGKLLSDVLSAALEPKRGF